MKSIGKARQQLDEIDRKIEACRIQYELFFSGIEKREPFQDRERLQRELRQMQNVVKSSVERFRLQSLNSKYNSLRQYWERVKFEREQGTYHKDRMRTRRRMGVIQTTKEGMATQTAPEHEHKERPTTYTLEDLLKPDLGARPPARATGPDSSVSDRGPSQERMQQIYQNFISTKQQQNESTAGVSFDAIQRKLARQVQKLEEKGYKNIDFRVVVKDGKTAFKAVGKKEDS